MTVNQSVPLSVPFEMIERFDNRNPRLFRQGGTCVTGKVGMSIDAGADSRPPHGKLQYGLQRLFRTADAELQLTSESAELLAQPQRRGIGQMRSSDLNDFVPLFGFIGQHLLKPLQSRNQ